MKLMVTRILFSMCLLLGSAGGIGAELDRITAVVDDDVIMRSELDQMMVRVRAELREKGAELPPIAVLERQVMDRLIRQKLQLDLAAQMGIDVTEEKLDLAINDIAKNNKVSMEQFKEILSSQGYDFNQFREDIRREIMVAKLRHEEVDRKIQISDREIDNEIRNGTDAGESRDEYHIAHILISIPTSATDAERTAAADKAKTVATRLADGADFGDIAVSMSDATDALDKGDLGWRKIDEIPSLFTEVVRGLAVNARSDVIKGPTGYHFVKLLGKRGGKQTMVQQVKVRHILIMPSQLIDEKTAISRLRQLLLRVEHGEDFAALARTHSDDRGSALQGGDLGWVSPGQMVPEFEEVMQATEPGTLSAPFHSEFGWHILQVIARRSYDGTREMLRNKAREAIMARKREEAFQNWQRQLRDDAYVEYRDAP